MNCPTGGLRIGNGIHERWRCVVVTLALVCLSATAACDDRGIDGAERGVALIVSVERAEATRWRKPGAEADADLVADAFVAAGYAVDRLRDPDRKALARAFNDQRRRVLADRRPASNVIYFNGYVVGVDGRNFVLPADTTAMTASAVIEQGLELEDALDAAAAGIARVSVVMIDASLAPSLAFRAEHVSPGPFAFSPPPRTLVLLARQPGRFFTEDDYTPARFAAGIAQAVLSAPSTRSEFIGRLQTASAQRENSTLYSGDESEPWRVFFGTRPIPTRPLPISSWRSETLVRLSDETLDGVEFFYGSLCGAIRPDATLAEIEAPFRFVARVSGRPFDASATIPTFLETQFGVPAIALPLELNIGLQEVSTLTPSAVPRDRARLQAMMATICRTAGFLSLVEAGRVADAKSLVPSSEVGEPWRASLPPIRRDWSTAEDPGAVDVPIRYFSSAAAN